jgi:hypothetical protein
VLYIGPNKNLRSVPGHMKIHYLLYFCWRFLLLHSPSIEIPILRYRNTNICQLLYLTCMGVLGGKIYSLKDPTLFLITFKVYLNERLEFSLHQGILFL